jgi:hypothetical protein
LLTAFPAFTPQKSTRGQTIGSSMYDKMWYLLSEMWSIGMNWFIVNDRPEDSIRGSDRQGFGIGQSLTK